jgi:hypothetical protein
VADNKQSDPDTDADLSKDTSDIGGRDIDGDGADVSGEPAADHAPDDSKNDQSRSGESQAGESQSEEPDVVPAAEPEPALQAAAEKAPQAVAPAASIAKDRQRRGGFVPALIGGVLAATLGFFAAQTGWLDRYLPVSLKAADDSEMISGLENAVARNAGDLSGLRAEIAARKPPDLAPLETGLEQLSGQIAPIFARLETVSAEISTLNSRFGPLEIRLADLEKRPLTEAASETAIAAYDRELAALQDSVAAQRTEVESMLNEARAAEKQAQALAAAAAAAADTAATRTVVAQLRAALDAGSEIASMLNALAAAGVDLPESLRKSATDGVATLALLRQTYPAAARDALAVARANSDGQRTGFTAFLQRQLGARSTEPRQGDDPDAILSRAEAALIAGDLSGALKEISALPEPARAAMGDWPDRAAARLAAVMAADALAQALNTN